VRNAVKMAAKKGGIVKRVIRHTFRHSFAAHLPETGYATQRLRPGQVSVRSGNS